MKRNIYAISLAAILIIFAGTTRAVGNDAAASGKTGAKAETRAESKAAAQAHTKVRLDRPTLQAVRARLFGDSGGTADNGLLDGKASFDFRAEHMTMTSAEAATFFTSTGANENFAALVKATEALHGTVSLDGTVDGRTFHMKIAGHQLKIQGLTLTAAQRETLVAELRGIDGLKEAKVEAVVDGKQTVSKIQAGKDRLEIAGSRNGKQDNDHGKGRVNANTRADANLRIDGPVRIQTGERLDTSSRLDRPGRIEAIGRSETSGRIDLDRVLPGLGRR